MTSSHQDSVEALAVSKVTVFFGGNVGSDHRSPMTWSGSGLFLLDAMKKAGMLDEATGVRVPYLHNSFLLAKNFNRDRRIWRTHYYFDPVYRRALSKAAFHQPVGSPAVLQIGHQFCLRDAFPDKICMSYHDGNLAVRLGSGFGFEGVSRRRIDQALRYEEQTAGQMDAIFTMSDYVRDSFISDYHVPAERVFSVGGGINLSQFPDARADKDYRVPRILFVGREFVRKGGPQLIEAFRKIREAIPTAELHIVGPAEVSNPPAGVTVHGFLSKAIPAEREKHEALLRTSTLFVLPSLYEPFGVAPLEAMLYQLPCVVTDAWALREMVTPGVNGEVFPRGSVDGLASKIIQLLSDPEGLATLGRQGRERVLRQYTWAAVVDRMASAQRTLGMR
jgi:glycosyltransferase involved in cell wall biosynthesis